MQVLLAQRLIVLILFALIASQCRVRQPRITPLRQTSDPVPTCRQVVAESPFGEVAWIGPENRRDRELLDRWCEAVGPLIVKQNALQEADPSSVDRLVLVTWNTAVGSGEVTAFVSSLRRGD